MTTDLDANLLFFLQNSSLLPSYTYYAHPRNHLHDHSIALRGEALEMKRDHTIAWNVVVTLCGLMLCLMLLFASQWQGNNIGLPGLVVITVIGCMVW